MMNAVSPTHEQRRSVQARRSTQTERLLQRQVKSLVMWSGGLDSTYSLVRLLGETDDEVLVHHVHCNRRRESGTGRSRRCEYEAQAVGRMLRLWAIIT